ncbi:hypothetical protein GL2_08530 [Microbulbifer sp. GL-2]|nr:hypothetical protein GL2_08530 [Microbulbifer sp. GL-2]
MQSANPERVIVEEALGWEQAVEKVLYCTVSTPFTYQISSHAQAQLTTVKPVGSTVNAGELVAEQDSYYLSREIDIIRTDLELVEIQLKHAKDELSRLETLRVSEMVSQSQLGDLVLQVDTYRLNRQRLKQQLQTNMYRFEHLKHFAPFSGQILQVDASPGERLDMGQRIVRLLPIKKKQFECKVPQEHAPKGKSLTDFHFRLHGKLISLRDIGVTVDINTQNLTLYFDGNSDEFESLLVGQRFQVSMVEQAAKMSLTESITRVPSDAVKLVGNSHQVWTVDQENKVDKVSVRILDTLASYFIIQSEIKPGDLLVVVGHEGLEVNQNVVAVSKAGS